MVRVGAAIAEVEDRLRGLRDPAGWDERFPLALPVLQIHMGRLSRVLVTAEVALSCRPR